MNTLTPEALQRIDAALEALRVAALALAKEVRRAQRTIRRPRVKPDVEREVLLRLAQKQKHREIAEALGISPGTVSRIRNMNRERAS